MTATFTASSADPGTPLGGSAPSPGWTPGGEDDRRLRVARWLLGFEEAGFAFVKVPEPIPHPSGDPKLADCHCPPDSTTRRKSGRCTAPGKHPVGESWQRSGSRDLRVIAGILRQPGFQLGVIVLPGGRGFVLDEDLRTGVDADALMAGWAEREGRQTPETFRVRSGGGGRHIHGLAPAGYVLPASWPGGEVRWAGDGTKGGGMVVAPFGLHATGARYEPLNQLRPAEFPGSLLDHRVR